MTSRCSLDKTASLIGMVIIGAIGNVYQLIQRMIDLVDLVFICMVIGSALSA